MGKTISELQSILMVGASITIDRKGKTVSELTSLSMTARNAGGILTIIGCHVLTVSELQSIGMAGKNHVHFIL